MSDQVVNRHRYQISKPVLFLTLESLASILFTLVVSIGVLRAVDVWWHLALGRWLVENQHLPATDPFSYTFALQPNRMYVLYQWLSEVVIFCVYKADSLRAVVALTSGLLFAAFVMLPLRALIRAGMPLWLTWGLLALGVWAGSFHFLARAEVFSFLFLAILLGQMADRRIGNDSESDKATSLDFKFIAVIAILFAAWCNFHSGFASGLLVLLLYNLCAIAASLAGRNYRLSDLTLLVSLPVACLASLINPYGIKLFIYLKDQLLFDPLNATIRELKPLNVESPSHQPYLVFLVVFILVFAWTHIASSDNGNKWKRQEIINLVMVIASAVFAFLHRRLILFSILVILFKLAVAWQRIPKSAENPVRSYLPAGKAAGLLLTLLPIVVGVATVCLSGQDYHQFMSLDRSISFLSKHAAKRHVFNDVEFGNMMLWRSPGNPPVFIDTRYDMYGARLVSDYDVLSCGLSGWKTVIDKYDIGLIFFPRNDPFVKGLISQPEWRVIYEDASAAILEKTTNVESYPGTHSSIKRDADSIGR